MKWILLLLLNAREHYFLFFIFIIFNFLNISSFKCQLLHELFMLFFTIYMRSTLKSRGVSNGGSLCFSQLIFFLTCIIHWTNLRYVLLLKLVEIIFLSIMVRYSIINWVYRCPNLGYYTYLLNLLGLWYLRQFLFF